MYIDGIPHPEYEAFYFWVFWSAVFKSKPTTSSICLHIAGWKLLCNILYRKSRLCSVHSASFFRFRYYIFLIGHALSSFVPYSRPPCKNKWWIFSHTDHMASCLSCEDNNLIVISWPSSQSCDVMAYWITLFTIRGC